MLTYTFDKGAGNTTNYSGFGIFSEPKQLQLGQLVALAWPNGKLETWLIDDKKEALGQLKLYYYDAFTIKDVPVTFARVE